MMTTPVKIVAYYRVSTKRQGTSGLGLEAQRAMVENYATSCGAPIVATFTEIESGGDPTRPILKAAQAEAMLRRATLVVAKLDRLSRDAHEITGLMKTLDFRCADSPDDPPVILQIRAALAEDERRKISLRTREALAALKARGVKLGGPNLVKGTAETAKHASVFANAAKIARAREKAAAVLPYVDAARRAGAVTLAELAQALTARGVTTPSGSGAWHPATVSRIVAYAQGDAR
jgi:DNA invertase Pin-like site-specific DNA recombinase